MKYMRSHGCRWLARVLTFVLAALQLLWGPPASAQRGPISVYVLDFNNRTTVGGALLGRVAAAQAALNLSESANWDVIPDAQVQRRIQELGLKQPFDRINRVQIANGVDATAVMYGAVLEARVTGQPMPQAFARVQMLIEDVGTSELINGAIAEGVSVPRMGFTGDADVLLEEAIGKAAFRAREFMDRFRLPEGTVLNTTVVGGSEAVNLDALINIGVRQGVRRGMTMIVTRQRDTVGRVKVTSVDTDVSTVRVVENTQGVRPEDRVRAIFNFADFPITRTRIRGAAPLEPVKVAMAGKPGEQGAARIAKAGRGDQFVPFRAKQDVRLALVQDTVQPPPPVVVDEPEVDTGSGGGGGKKILSGGAFKMLVGGLLVLGILALGGRGGQDATRADGVEAFARQDQVGTQSPVIRVSWDRPKAVNQSSVLQYVVWREDLGGNFAIQGGVHGDSIHYFDDDTTSGTFPNVYTGLPGGDAGTPGDITRIGIIAGNRYRYQISTAFENGLEDLDGDGVPDDLDLMSPLSGSSPWITALRPPIITDPKQDDLKNLNALSVTWQLAPGADTYFIWVSRNPNFPRDSRVVRGPFRVVPDDTGQATATQVIDVSGVRRGGRPVFLAVGGKNSQDRLTPRPFGAVFSRAISVRSDDTPPPPPGATTGDARPRGRSQGRRGAGRNK